MRPMLQFVQQRGSAAAKARAQAGLQALRSQATAGGTLGAAGVQQGGKKGGQVQCAEQQQSSTAVGGLHATTAPADFDEMLALNAQLRDKMQPYQGTAPPAPPAVAPPTQRPLQAAPKAGGGVKVLQRRELSQSKAASSKHGAGAGAQAAQDNGSLRGLSNREEALTFDELLAQNALLQKQDAMPAYSGVRPAYQAIQVGVPPADAAAPRTQPCLPAQRVQWEPVVLHLPRIKFDVARAADGLHSSSRSSGCMADAPAGNAAAALAPSWTAFALNKMKLLPALSTSTGPEDE